MKKYLLIALTLLMAVGMQAETVSFAASELNNASTSATKNGVTIVLAQGTGAKAPSYNTQYSALQAVSGNTMSVSAPTGMLLTQVEFTMYNSYMAGNLNNATWSTGSKSVNDVKVTWTGEAESLEVTFTGAVGFVSFAVNYKEPAIDWTSTYNDTTMLNIANWVTAWNDENPFEPWPSGYVDSVRFNIDDKSVFAWKETEDSRDKIRMNSNNLELSENSTLVITAPYKMHKVVLTFSDFGTSNPATRWMDRSTCSSGEMEAVDSKTVIWTGSAAELTFLDGYYYELRLMELTIISDTTANTSSVTFLGWDGQPVGAPQTVAIGGNAVAPTGMSGEHSCMVFTGWDKEFTNVHNDIKVQSLWELDNNCMPEGYVKVVFVDFAGKQIDDPQFVLIGGNAVAPDTPQLPGHAFAGWDHALTNLTQSVTIKPIYTFNPNSPDIMTVSQWCSFKKTDEFIKAPQGETYYAVKGLVHALLGSTVETGGTLSFRVTDTGEWDDCNVEAYHMLGVDREPFYSIAQLSKGDTVIVLGTYVEGKLVPGYDSHVETGLTDGYTPYIGRVNPDDGIIYVPLQRADVLYDFSGNGLKQMVRVEHSNGGPYYNYEMQQTVYDRTTSYILTKDVTEQFRLQEALATFTYTASESLGSSIAYFEHLNADNKPEISTYDKELMMSNAGGYAFPQKNALAVTNMDINSDGRKDYLVLDQSIPLTNRISAEYGAIAYQLADGSFQEQRMQVFTWDEFVAQMTPEELDQYNNPQAYSLGEVSRYTYPVTLGAVCLARTPRRNAPEVKKAPGLGTRIGAPTKVIDLNKDGLMDLIDEKSGIIYTNMDNGKWVWTTTNGAVVPADLNNDGVMDFVFPGERLYTVIYDKTTKNFVRTLLYQNAASDDIVYCYDFDKDGDVDILATFTAENNTTGYAYTCFFTNNGQGVFSQQQDQNYGANKLAFMTLQDLDGDGYYDLLAYNPTSNDKYNLVWLKGQSGLHFNTTPQVLATDIITRQTYWDSSKEPFTSYPVSAEDLDGDGKMEIWVSNNGSQTTKLYTIEGAVANVRPNAPAQPTLNYANGKLTITWGNGADDKTAVNDLTYALRIGTTPGGNDILAAHANADGTRRNFLDGNMGKEHTYTIDLSSYSPATIYVAVQAIDAQHFGSAWSQEATAVHDIVPVEFTLDKTTIAINEKAVLTYTTLPEGYTHQWTVQDGSYEVSTESAAKLLLSFTSGGTKTITHTVTTPNSGTLSASATIVVLPAGLGEPIQLTEDQKLSISTPMGDFNNDGRMDGVLPSDYYSGSYYAITVQEGVNNANLFAKAAGLWNTNIITEGYLINSYYLFNDIFWYDWNKDGHMDMLFREYYHHNTSTYYSYGYLPYDAVNNSLSVRVNDPELESFFAQRQQENAPFNDFQYVLTDLDNNGYLDSVACVSNPAEGEDATGIYAWYKEADNVIAEGFLLPKANGCYLRDCYLTPNDHYLWISSTLYPIVTQADVRPAAPTNVQASMTNEGLLITWTAAVDDHTPAANMRYNLSVKQQGATTYLISPQNGGNDNTAFIPDYDYAEGTSYLIPTSDLSNGNYEIAIQALDRQNKLSVFSQTIIANVARNPIEVPSFACADEEVLVSYRGAETSGTPAWTFDGGMAEGYGFGPYNVTWSTGGVKTITLTVNGQTYSQTITIDDPKALEVSLPTVLYEETPASASVPDGIEYAWYVSIDGGELCRIDQYGVVLPSTSIFVSYDYRLSASGLNVTAHYKSNYSEKTLVGHQVVLYLLVTNANGCETYFTSNVTVMAATNIPTLTLVTTDANGHNVLSWTGAEAFAYVQVYKEGSYLDDFRLIGSANAAAGTYTDNASDASQKAERYRLTGITADGNESPTSAIHKTVHLTINRGVQNGTYNLIWNEYAGASVSAYRILRGASPTNLSQIAVVASSNTSYTDQTPDDNLPYYAIEYQLSGAAAAPAANHAAQANLSGRSNVVDRRTMQGLEEVISSQSSDGKLLINGVIYILRGEKVYTVTGQEVR